ncbi:MAG: MjaI family restriction endonuclease [Oscillospiraceae bacterium]|nr:MjaI family restriction endonuclease [Oscillospiraceae bacterium]
MKYTINNTQIEQYNNSKPHAFPKYTSQLINCANQNARGTRPTVVGQLSELFPEFLNSDEEKSVDGWRRWYTRQYPDAIEKATDKICNQIENLRNALPLIDRDMIKAWVEDLTINKTFNGLYVQKAILASLARERGETYCLASPAEEAKGIDGFVGDVPYSIKPETYKTMGRLPEVIDVKMIYYVKTKTGLKYQVED